MADDFSFKIQGLEALSVKLKVVSDDIKFKGGRFALRKAANLVRDIAIQNALKIDDPETAEKIAANIVVRFSSSTFKRTGNIMFRIGVLGGARSKSKDAQRSARRRRRAGVPSLESLGEIPGAGKANPGGDTFHWRFIEFGTSRSRAQPFMRRSLSENTAAATDEFVRQYDKALERALRKAERAAANKR